MNDSEEFSIGTDPLDSDTDNDGWSDGDDPAPLNSSIPNLYIGMIGIPSVILLALAIYFRKRVIAYSQDLWQKGIKRYGKNKIEFILSKSSRQINLI